MATNGIKKMNATDIVGDHLYANYPNLKIFLEILVMDVDIETKRVGRKFKYRPSVSLRIHFLQHGVLMDLFIRKVLSQKYDLKLKDDYAERVLADIDTIFTPSDKKIISPKDFEKHYKMFIDSQTQAIDILESLKKVALSKTLCRKDFQLAHNMVDINKDNFLEVEKYFKRLSYSGVEIKCNVDCKFFEAKADFVFDKKVIYEIKTSKYSSLSRFESKLSLKNFNKLLLYGFGYYKKNGIIINNYKIYNPLLGEEHSIKIDDIDMIHFEEVLNKDIKLLKTYK